MQKAQPMFLIMAMEISPGKRALGLPVNVLGAHGDIHAVELEDALHRLEIHKRRADGHVHQLEPVALHAVRDLLSEHHGLGDGVVHLPVAGNEVLAGHIASFLAKGLDAGERLALDELHGGTGRPWR